VLPGKRALLAGLLDRRRAGYRKRPVVRSVPRLEWRGLGKPTLYQLSYVRATGDSKGRGSRVEGRRRGPVVAQTSSACPQTEMDRCSHAKSNTDEVSSWGRSFSIKAALSTWWVEEERWISRFPEHRRDDGCRTQPASEPPVLPRRAALPLCVGCPDGANPATTRRGHIRESRSRLTSLANS
jgi:hypothetical protein